MTHLDDKTLYLWDLAGTLFHEAWNTKLTGYESFEAYAAARGATMATPRQFEDCYREPYLHGEMFNLALQPGFKEVLSSTKHNETFSTGFKSQVDWRAEYLNPRVGFDIRQYFQKLNSTFDYGETNVKTQAMLARYLEQKYGEGYRTVVYADDKLENGELFKRAMAVVRQEHPDFESRFYHVANDRGGLRGQAGYWQVGDLYDILENEQKLKTANHL